MKRIVWMVLFLGAYIWVVSSEHDQVLLEKGKALYEAIVKWFEGADVDYQVKKSKELVKKHRRWDERALL